MSNNKEGAKIVVSFRSYNSMVLDADKAVQIMELMRGAERYEFHYEGSTSTSTTHIFPHSGEDVVIEAKFLTDAQYALAKVAGAPPKRS